MSETLLPPKIKGLVYGLLAGEVIGASVEGYTFEEREASLQGDLDVLLVNNYWQTQPGQLTDSGELALLLCRLLAYYGQYDEEEAWHAYAYWLRTDPFSITHDLKQALLGKPKDSCYEASALTRIAPLALKVSHFSLPQLASWAMADTALTHPQLLNQQVSALFVMTLGYLLENDASADEVYVQLTLWAQQLNVDPLIQTAIQQALFVPTTKTQQADLPILVCFQNALWQLLYAADWQEGVYDTILRVGDCADSAAVTGALLGACYGSSDIPPQILKALTKCRPLKGHFGVKKPRPECCWATEIDSLAWQIMQCEKKPAKPVLTET